METKTMAYQQTKRRPGRHFLQIPGPTNVPDRVLRAIDNAVIDQRGPDFAAFNLALQTKLRRVFKTAGPVIMYPGSGSGAWEAALVNTLSPGDTVLMCQVGWFATLWYDMARRLGLEAIMIETDWRRATDVEAIGQRLRADTAHRIKAVCVVHNETSTGVTSRLDEVRAVMDAADHPALLMADTISSLASIDYRHDQWGVDVCIGGSQKGLMLPAGLSFNAISDKALAAQKTARLPRSYWDWQAQLDNNATGYFPYTPAANLMYGLDAAIDMLEEEGLDNVFARHDRHAEATRRAVRAWGLEIQCADPRHYSSTVTSVRVPEGHSADALRASILEKSNMSLGNGLGPLKDRVFRVGHLGDLGDLQVIGVLGGIEIGLRRNGIPHQPGGVQAAVDFLAGNA
jgi:alanine-glyoxylate transaminase/serine-glyoxylate transaminase/serine-pyruvate transaminase